MIKSANRVFVFNNKQYILPNIQTNNRKNFEVLKAIMLNYTYNEFVKSFDYIYNHSYNYSKVMCCYMREICRQYDKIKQDNPTWRFSEIVCKMKFDAECEYRPNNKYFHVNYINLVLYWKYYKINYNNCDTINLFNSLLDKLELPKDLRTGFPELVDIFKVGLKPVFDRVVEAHKLYYKEKNEKGLEELDKKFKLEFKEKLNEYESYFNRIRDKCCCYVDFDIIEILFGFNDDKDNENCFGNKFRLYMTNKLLKKLIKHGEYKNLKDKYEYIELDYHTQRLSKYIYNNFGGYIIGLKDEVTPKQVSDWIEEKVKNICSPNQYKPKYNFKSKEHEELIMNLIQ